MKTQTLANTNPYLKDSNNRNRLVHRSVRTSCGVEGIYEKSMDTCDFNTPSQWKKKIYNYLPK